MTKQGMANTKKMPIEQFITSYLISKVNFEDMNELIKDYSDKEYAINLFKDDKLLIGAGYEYLRLIFNYLSSAFALVEHCRKFIDNNYSDTDIQNKYKELITEHISGNNITSFVKNLRNYFMHIGFPMISNHNLFISVEGNVNLFIELDKNDLKDWNGWNKNAREYIETLNNKVYLHKIIIDYEKIIDSFYTQFFEELYRK